jgi:hypothetical protein
MGLLARSGSRWRLTLAAAQKKHGSINVQEANGCRIFAIFEIKNKISGRIVLARQFR